MAAVAPCAHAEAQADATAQLWQRYRADGDIAARDALFAMHMPWAMTVGRSVYRRVARFSLDRDDFVQNAELGLLEALERFDPGRGVDFRAYARSRVRGAVFNGVRNMLRHGGRPDDADRHAERLADFHEADADPLDAVIEAVVGLGIGFLLEHAAEHERCGYTYARREQTSARLMAAVGRLPPRMRHIVTAHYFDHVPFTVLADQLQLTRGRVSQLHREALSRMRDALRDYA